MNDKFLLKGQFVNFFEFSSLFHSIFVVAVFFLFLFFLFSPFLFLFFFFSPSLPLCWLFAHFPPFLDEPPSPTMGNCASSSRTWTEQSTAIDKELKAAKQAMSLQRTILLLGPGDCGKSTFARQLTRLFGSGLDEESRKLRVHMISNIASGLADVVQYASQQQPPGFSRAKYGTLFSILEADPPVELKLDTGTIQMISDLWEEPLFQEIVNDGVLSCTDTLRYLLAKIDQLAAEDYTPDHADVARTRRITSGVHETFFTRELGRKQTQFRVVDVGGQRSERRKWLSCFETVDLVCFFVSLAEYNQTLAEDPSVRRLDETMALFREVLDARALRELPFVIYFTKPDLFEQKIDRIPLNSIVSAYTGPPSAEASRQWIVDSFLQIAANRPSQRTFHHSLLCTIDHKSVKLVFATMSEDIFLRHLSACGVV